MTRNRKMRVATSGPGKKNGNRADLRIFSHFNAKTNPETSVLGREITETDTEFKIPQPPNTNSENF